ncbi:polymorphic toxin-type HINT domain-containing protein, partial [Actinomadura sp. HBU206391]|uniref:polymorphic toxin-type HINT domain-containing protein n=1 Tax=Actinomadura sp. HBU206391 TaxID=2731692 RepID=UPI00164FDCA5
PTTNYTREYTPPTTGHRLPAVNQTGTNAHLETFTYDEAGNTTQRKIGSATQTLDWDNEGELTKLTDTAKGETSYLYDADGNRLIRRDPTGTTLYLPRTELHQAKDATTATGTRYYTHAGQTIAMRTNAGVQFLSPDHHGTAELQINASTQTLTQRRFTPFGQPRGTATGTWTGDQNFVGGTRDTATDLIHLGAREYDPNTGRFISVDPLFNLEFPQGYNGYSYSNHNPVNISDPTGLDGPLTDSTRCLYNIGGCKNKSKGKAPTSPAPDYPGFFPDTPAGPTRHAKYSKLLQDLELPHDAEEYRVYMQAKLAFCSEYPSDSMCGGSNPREALAGVGALPVPGSDIADAVNGVWYLLEGDWKNALASGLAIVPLLGSLAVLRKGAKGTKGGIPKACSSFVPGTEVLLANGEQKPIEDIKAGDKILATDPETGQTQAKDVLATITSNGQKNLVEVTVDTDGKHGDNTGLVIATDSHPFWVAGKHKKWTKAADLKPGMWLRTSAGTHTQITAINTWTRHQQVHNLTIDGIHTYYVEAGNTPVLVHNSNCGLGRDLIDGDAQYHIIAGNRTGGGHKWPGQPGKTVFPESWDTDKILDGVADVATNPTSTWMWQKGAQGSMYTKKGDPSRVKIEGVYDGVNIRVIYEPATARVITGFPIG